MTDYCKCGNEERYCGYPRCGLDRPIASSGNSELLNGHEHGTPYVLQKNGMYYAHNNCGYVSRVLLAEIYTKEYAESYARQSEEVMAIPVTELLTGADEVQEYIDRLLVMKAACEAI